MPAPPGLFPLLVDELMIVMRCVLLYDCNRLLSFQMMLFVVVICYLLLLLLVVASWSFSITLCSLGERADGYPMK